MPDVEHVILARPLRKSLSLHIQMIGRGARISAGKEFCVLQDNSGNYLRFKEDWDRIYAGGIHELNDDAEKPRKELTEREKTIAKCPKCTALWLGGDTCAHCGYTHEKKNRAEAVAGSILELSAHTTKQEKYSSEYKEQFYQQLLYVARAKGHQDGAAWHQYQKKFGVKPPWKKATMQPTPDVLNWLKSRAIASSFARGKSR